MQSHYLFYSLLFSFTAIYSVEYVYPVACLDNGATILLIHQRTSQQIELLQWNTQTNSVEQILWSLFNPAGFQLLPNHAGFSFIDNGRLHIKLFNKRSPQAIDFDEPIININALQWIDEETCYCSAQQGDDYAIFQLHVDGALQCIMCSDHKDCLYPQKVGAELFYIERDKSNAGDVAYHVIVNSQGRLDFDNPIIFLQMQSPQEGFVLEHSKTIDTQDAVIQFVYHQIHKNGETWNKQILFSFAIPCSLLLQSSDDALYESIVPLLPRVIDNVIYFVDTSVNNIVEPYCYDRTTGICNKVVLPPARQPESWAHSFVPMLCGEQLYCGGTWQSDRPEPLTLILT